jgi:hypothetical protein
MRPVHIGIDDDEGGRLGGDDEDDDLTRDSGGSP